MDINDSNSVVRVVDLSIGYAHKKETFTVAKGINFQLNEGLLIGLVGANGIGKSTLLRTLSGIQPPLAGKVIINETPIEQLSSPQLALYLSVVLTEAPVSKNLSVQEFISLGRQPHTNWFGKLNDFDRDKIMEAMALTDTQKLAHRKCFELSDGQLQRVAIARALAQDTPIIILDEPTTHLDLFHRARILKLLKKLAKEMKKTILYSTHEVDLAIQLSDRMMILSSDKFDYNDPCMLIEQGSFSSLFPEDTILFDGQTGRFTVKD